MSMFTLHRRKFLSSLGILAVPVVAVKASKLPEIPKENPESLPVLRFKDGYVSNHVEIFGDIPFERQFFSSNCDQAHRQVRVWVRKEDAVTMLGPIVGRSGDAIWGETVLIEGIRFFPDFVGTKNFTDGLSVRVFSTEKSMVIPRRNEVLYVNKKYPEIEELLKKQFCS